MEPLPSPGPAAAWIAALRFRTLAASIAPVIVGVAFAYAYDVLAMGPAAAALVGAILIQLGTNLANDYEDHKRGADTHERVGPPRATAMGWIPATRVRAAAIAAFATAALVGVYLAWVAGWPILFVGVAAIASGWAYTGGPYPLGYHGWGDAFVFVFFGPVAVAGTYFVQAGPAPTAVVVAGIGVGALATAILVVNNLRDIDTDARAGKRTLAVRMGSRATRAEYGLLFLVAYAAPLVLVGAFGVGPWALLPGITLPLAGRLVYDVASTHDARALNPLLGRTARTLALYGLLLAAGVAFA